MSDNWTAFDDLLDHWWAYRHAVEELNAHEPPDGTGYDPPGDRKHQEVADAQKRLQETFEAYVWRLIEKGKP